MLKRIAICGCLLATCHVSTLSVKAQIRGGMLDPSVDTAEEPFSYFWHPTDVIGALYDPVASEVTPEGYVYTGFGELMFFVGNPPEAINERIKTLDHGYEPIVQYGLERANVQYRFRIFAADLGQGLQGLPLNFIEVRVHNNGQEDRTAYLSSAYRFSPPINGLEKVPAYRFRQRFDLISSSYTKGQSDFNPHWNYSFGLGKFVRDGRILYTFPSQPQSTQVSLSLEDNGLRTYRYFTGEVEGSLNPTYRLSEQTPMGVVSYGIHLKPGETKSLVFKMPIVPLPENTAQARQMEEADYGSALERTESFWQGLVKDSSPLVFPEAKVQETLLANTVFDLLAIDRVGSDYIPNVNKFQYHAFYGGSDTSHMLVALDYLGLTDPATNAALYSMKSQTAEGAFVGKDDTATRRYWEMFGNTLWTWGRHYMLTRDTSFLRQIYPSVVQAMAWEAMVTESDPLGLMPVFGVPDDAGLKNAHQTGQDLWTLAGIRNAIEMAEGMGNHKDAERFRADYARLWKAFDKQLSIQTAKTGGYIPPALDLTLQGNNWDNLLTLYPEPLFKPFDPRVTATIQESRKTYAEGILGYVLPIAIAPKGDQPVYDTTPLLHYWHSLDNAENGLVRGDPQDQELAVKDLYAMLLHTTSTHATQEFGTYPMGTRDYYGDDILPDGATSGVLIELMRNMLVREYQEDLYLFSAVSPAWLQPDQQIEIRKEPTIFGPISATLKSDSDGWDVQLSNQFRQAPQHLMITIPWFYEAQAVEADGKPVQVTDGKLVLDPTTRHVHVRGKIKSDTSMMSYESAVEDYKREYKQRYEEFLRIGRDLSPPTE